MSADAWGWVVILGAPTLAAIGLYVMWRVMDR